MTEMSIVGTGMVSSVGHNAAASCAAIRASITGFSETRFMLNGAWVLGAEYPSRRHLTGRSKLIDMACAAIAECLAHQPSALPNDIPLLLCLSERDRPGRPDFLDESFFWEIQSQLGIRFHEDSLILSDGRIGPAKAIILARDFLAKGRPYCIVAAVDSFLTAFTLESFDDARLVLTKKNSDGFIPGEAASAVMLAPESSAGCIKIRGVGFGAEPAFLDSERPLRGTGLANAVKAAAADAGVDFSGVDYRICDANGLQYSFREATLALGRIIRPVKQEFDVWHPADCIGEVGSAAGPAILVVAAYAYEKRYAPGPGVLCHFSNFQDQRAAVILGTPTG